MGQDQVPPKAASSPTGGWLPSGAVPAAPMAVKILANDQVLYCRPEVDKVREQVLQRNPQVRLLLVVARYDMLVKHAACAPI